MTGPDPAARPDRGGREESVTPEELTERTHRAADGDTEESAPDARWRCLVTNDDGIDSPGLHALARAAARAGLHVVVAAPATESSGASASIIATEGDSGRLPVQRRTLPGLDGVEAFAVGALPAFIALTAVRGAFGDPPDLVLSGINNGPNTGHAILHSGTVGAVLTAAAHHTSALAVSLGVGTERHWETAAGIAEQVLSGVMSAPRGTAVNLNVPSVEPGAVRGLRQAPLASFGAVQTNVLDAGSDYVQIGVSEIDPGQEPGTDAALLAEGWATLTSLRPVCQGSDIALPGVLDADAEQIRT